jgi:hypothetical protein
VATICTAYFNVKKLEFFSEFMYAFNMNLKIKSSYSVNRLVILVQMQCVYFEIETKNIT